MRLSALGSALIVLAACGAAGCGSSPTTSGSTQDKGVDPGTGQGGTTPDKTGTEVNPYGKNYPTANLGYQPRAGTRPGNIMRNFKFLGYRDGDPSKGLEVVSLANYYDPEMRKYKVIHMSAAALWCGPCNQEAEATVPKVKELADKKVVFVQAIIQDNFSKPAAKKDLDEWQRRHNVNFTIFLDPDQENLGQFFEAAAIPWNADLDARSMEILDSGVGYNPDIAGEVTTWLNWIDKNPAQKTE